MTLIWWAIIALVVSIIAAVFGFTEIAAGAALIARVLFGIFLLIALALFVLFIVGMGTAAAAAEMHQPFREVVALAQCSL